MAWARASAELALVALVALVAACGGPAAPPATVGNTAPPLAPAVLVLAGDHLGPITATTPITVDRIRAAFPEATVTARSFEQEDGTHDVIEVRRGEALAIAFTHTAGQLVAADAPGIEVRTSAGVGVGSDYDQVEAGLGGVDCLGMVEEDAGNAICWSLETPQLAAILPMPQDDSESRYYGKPIPADQAAVVLRGVEVQRMRWMPTPR